MQERDRVPDSALTPTTRSDNIMKGFATSLAIVLSFCAGIILFDFNVTLSFLVGTAMVVASTYLYNQPDGESVWSA